MASKSGSVKATNENRADASRQVQVVVHPYGSALPLGCFAFCVGNALTSAFYLHWISMGDQPILAIMLLAFVAPLEFISCIMAFLSRDTGGATAMGIFSAAWVVQGIELANAKLPIESSATGIFLIMLSIFLIIMASATFNSKPLLGILLSVAVLRSIGASLMQFGFSRQLSMATAILGFTVSAFALYSGLGFLLEDIQQRPLSMTFRRGKAKVALENSFQDQVADVAHEAGVRNQL